VSYQGTFIYPFKFLISGFVVANMKASIFCSATLFTWATLAFPSNILQGDIKTNLLKGSDISQDTLAEITALSEKIARDLETKSQGGHVKRAFNAEAQRISITGDHKYVCSCFDMETKCNSC
jgi:hypothetical protein